MTKHAIDILNVFFSYPNKEKPVFSDLTLSIPAKEISCLLGHNGAGKSTLLKLSSGFLKPKKGRVILSHDSIRDYRKVMFVGDENRRNRDLSTQQLIFFRSMFFGLSIEPRGLHELIHSFKFEKYLDLPIRELSSGNTLRSSLISGLAFSPSLILLDEPTNSIDPETRELLKQVLPLLKNEGATILFASHDLDFVHSVADNSIVINQGAVSHFNHNISRWNKNAFVDEYISLTSEGETYV